MNILLCGDYRLPNHDAGSAIPRISQSLISGFDLISQDVDFEVLARKEEISSDFTEKVDGHVVHYFSIRRPKLGSSLVRDVPDLRKRMRFIDPDVIHAQDPVYAYCGLKENIPTVLTLHGMVWREMEYNLRSKDPSLVRKGVGQKLVYARLYNHVLVKLRHLILISAYVKNEIIGKYSGSSYVIENPIPEKFFHVRDTSYAGSNLIFSMGVISSRKNQMKLLEVAKHLNDAGDANFVLDIAGSAQDLRYYQELQRYIQTHNIGNVSFLGRIPDEQLCEKYAQMSAFCLTSRQETAPMVISEAMACGKPVIGSNVCGIPYMIRDGVTGYLVDSDDTKDFAGKIQKLFDHEERRRTMGERAREDAMKRWHPSVVAEQTLQVYRNAS